MDFDADILARFGELNHPTDVDRALTVKIYERLFAQNAISLSDAELLAALISPAPIPQSAVRLADIVCKHRDGVHGLVNCTLDDLMSIDELAESQVVVLLSLIELSRRMHNTQVEKHPIIVTAADAAKLFMDMEQLSQEHVRVMLLDPQRRVIRVSTVYIGTLNTAVVRVSEILREAIIHKSASMILAHNHPGGSAQPSPEDVDFTRMLTAAGDLLQTPLIDHLIIGHEGWASLREMGLM